MTSVVSKLSDIQARLDALAKQHRVVGASLGILHDRRFVEFATGLANAAARVETTPDTLFQIGSNTKLMTTTLVMQLVEQGLVELDVPVRKYVPGFRLADEQAAASITVRHLLTHSSGMQGDYFEDFGRGDDSLERYVDSFDSLTQVHEPGELYSYCNSGFCLAGLLIEKVTGRPYHEVIRERLFDPLQMRDSTVLLDEMVAHRYAVGHQVRAARREPDVVDRVMMSRAHAPAGSLTSSTPRELLKFARCHLEGGVGPEGVRVLSRESVAAMQQPQMAKPPALGKSPHVGLGWQMSDWDGHRSIGHTGGTIGQLSYFQLLPDLGFAVALFTNTANAIQLWYDLGRYLFEELAGVAFPALPRPPDTPYDVDVSKLTGTYERLSVRYDVTAQDGGLVAGVTQSGPLAPKDAPVQTIRLEAIDDTTFFGRGPAGEQLVSFLHFDDGGRPAYLHTAGRAARASARQ